MDVTMPPVLDHVSSLGTNEGRELTRQPEDVPKDSFGRFEI